MRIFSAGQTVSVAYNNASSNNPYHLSANAGCPYAIVNNHHQCANHAHILAHTHTYARYHLTSAPYVHATCPNATHQPHTRSANHHERHVQSAAAAVLGFRHHHPRQLRAKPPPRLLRMMMNLHNHEPYKHYVIYSLPCARLMIKTPPSLSHPLCK